MFLVPIMAWPSRTGAGRSTLAVDLSQGAHAHQTAERRPVRVWHDAAQ